MIEYIFTIFIHLWLIPTVFLCGVIFRETFGEDWRAKLPLYGKSMVWPVLLSRHWWAAVHKRK